MRSGEENTEKSRKYRCSYCGKEIDKDIYEQHEGNCRSQRTRRPTPTRTIDLERFLKQRDMKLVREV